MILLVYLDILHDIVSTNCSDIDNIVTLNNIMLEPLKACKVTRATNTHTPSLNSILYSSWYDSECELLIQVYNKHRNNYKASSVVADKQKRDEAIRDYMFVCVKPKLTRWSDQYGIISQTQFAYRHNYNTIDAVFVLKTVFSFSIITTKGILCGFIDLSKAFDNIETII